MRRAATAILTILALGCSGGSGTGATAREGILYGFDGDPVPGTAVRLLSIDDRGDETAQLGLASTDGDGRFEFDLDRESNAGVVVEATVETALLRGFWAGSAAGVEVSPLTDGLVSVVVDIASSAGGRSLADFSPDELRALAEELRLAGTTGLDRRDPEAVREFVRENFGRAVAVAAGGAIQAASTADFEETPTVTMESIGTDPRVVPTDIDQNCGTNIYLLASTDFEFDPISDGSLCGKTNGGLPAMLVQGAAQLSFPEDLFFLYGGSSFPLAGSTASVEDGREFELGAFSLQKPVDPMDPMVEEDDTVVSRKIYVPASGDYVRYLEIVDNQGATDRTVDLALSSSLFTSNDSALLARDPAHSLGQKTRFAAAYDVNEDKPTVGFAFQDGLGSLGLSTLYAPGIAGGGINEVAYRWNGVTVPAGERRIVIHYLWLTPSRDATAVRDALLRMTEAPDMDGMTVAELESIVNFSPSRGTVMGEAGSVVGYATVSAGVVNTARSLTVTARRDGSFAVPLDVASGEDVVITASDGLMTFLTVP